MAKKIDVLKLVEKRDKKLRRANDYYIKMRKLEYEAENLDIEISNFCDHPKEYLKLSYFADGIPQKSMWMCKLCYQAVDFNHKEAKEVRLTKEVDFLKEVWAEIPTEHLIKDIK
jgi:hypothetical protein